MGAGTAIAVILLVIIMVGVLVLGTDLFTSLFSKGGEFFTATKLKVNPASNEIICDLKIETNVDIVQDIIISNPKFNVPSSNSHKYTWYSCFLPSNYVTYNLLDAGFGSAPKPIREAVGDLQTNILFLPTGGDITQGIRLIDSRDPTQVVDWNLQPNLQYKIDLPSGINIATPYSVDATFVVSNIPVREYNLEIHLSGLPEGVNNQPVGQPFTGGKVCDNVNKLVNNQCNPI